MAFRLRLLAPSPLCTRTALHVPLAPRPLPACQSRNIHITSISFGMTVEDIKRHWRMGKMDEETMRRQVRQVEEAEAKTRAEKKNERSYGDDLLTRLKKYEAETAKAKSEPKSKEEISAGARKEVRDVRLEKLEAKKAEIAPRIKKIERP